MKWSNTLLTLGALASSVVASVPSLTTEDFQSTINSAPGPVLVKFFAPWCGHCKKLAPKYEEASTALTSKNVTLVEVDCTTQSDLCTKYEIRGYPTLKVFQGGNADKEPSDYTGTREVDGIVSYMTKQTLPVVTPINSKLDLENFRAQDNAVLVAVLDEDDKEHRDLINEIAKANTDSFIVGLSKPADYVEVTKGPKLFALRNFDGDREDYEGDWSSESVLKFAKSATTPLVEQILPENFARIASSGRPIGFIFMPPNAPYHKEVIEWITPIAKKYRDDVVITYINADLFKDHAHALGIPEAKWPAFAFQDTVRNKKFPLPQDRPFDAENVEAFISQVVKGDVAPTIRSEPIPTSQDEDVHVIVANSFNEDAQNSDKNVLVEFYAPWCGHCKKLKPTYDELAVHYKDADDILIAKFDGSANDFPDVESIQVVGFPSLYFRPKGSKEWIAYEGNRQFDDLVKFVESNAVRGDKAGHDEL